MKNDQQDNNAKNTGKFSGRQSADNGRKIIKTEKITEGKKDDKKEKEKEENDASQWRNEG
jgi:hypothetical protein